LKNTSLEKIRLITSILLPIGFLLFLFFQWQTGHQNFENQWYTIIGKKEVLPQNVQKVNSKQKGVHFFGSLDSTNLQALAQNNIEWLTLVPWGGQKDFDSPIVKHYYGDSLEILRRDSSWVNRIELARAAGFKVFVKPHVWINNPSNNTWRSDIFPTTDENWLLWKKSYRDFTFRCAKIAAQANAEMFCIGTEFTRLAIEKPLFWKKLIREVRAIYPGKITYAANWYKEYEKITFWEELDFIGIQAYFPLVKNEYPSVQDISKGWKKQLPVMKAIHEKYNRPILFTEIGYKSTSDSAVEPWLWIEKEENQNKSLSLETQANCYESFFKTVWKKEWFAGMHIWQMNNFTTTGGPNCLDFTPQGKPAAAIIAKGFE